MTASNNSLRLLVVSSFCDRPEREIFCRLASEVSVSMICDPETTGQIQLKKAGVETIPFSIRSAPKHSLAEIIKKTVIDNNITAVYAPRTETLSASINALKGLETKLAGYRGTTGHLSIVDIGPRLAYTNPRVDMIICVSNAVRDFLASKGISREKLITIHKGHDVSWYKPAPKESLREFGIPDGAFVVGFAGRTRRIKGVRYLISAIAQIPPEIKAHLLIAGDIDDIIVSSLLKTRVAKERVHCAGFRDDASALMGACDAFVMPSLKREGLPRALIEAMSQSVPCVATSVGGIPELIENGKSGILVPPRNSKAISSALTSLASDKSSAKNLAKNARSRIETHFNIEDTVKQMLETFKS